MQLEDILRPKYNTIRGHFKPKYNAIRGHFEAKI